MLTCHDINASVILIHLHFPHLGMRLSGLHQNNLEECDLPLGRERRRTPVISSLSCHPYHVIVFPIMFRYALVKFAIILI